MPSRFHMIGVTQTQTCMKIFTIWLMSRKKTTMEHVIVTAPRTRNTMHKE